ncbi:MAG: PD-(D/E)XK nuclease family protein [Cyanobacteria bacterium P01_H01_bin.74]
MLNQLSAEALKYWSRCKKQFYYRHIARLQWPSDTQHFSLGRDVHKLLDYQARGLACNHLLESASKPVRQTWEKLIQHESVSWQVLANEWAFHLPIQYKEQTQWFTGRIDRVSRLPSGKIAVIDWKTGTGVPKNPDLDWQTRLYLYAVLETAGSPSARNLGFQGAHNVNSGNPLCAEDLVFIYVEAKATPQIPVRLVTINYNTEKHMETRAALEASVSLMAKEKKFPLPENNQCPDRYCVYRTICGISPVAC